MSERWAQPPKILEVEESATETVTFPDGRRLADVDIVVDGEDWERLRQGRLCLLCLEPQSVPFPEVCELRVGARPVCGYRIRDRQSRDFAAKALDGSVRIGSRISAADEFLRMQEHAEYEKRTGIVLPDSVKFPSGQIT